MMDFYILIGLVILALAIVSVGWLWSTYNTLVKFKVRVETAWSDVNTQLKRRADLLPSIVEVVKGYASHEQGVYEAVTEARASIMSASTPADAATAEGQLESALKTLFAVAEAYPDLKASTNFLQLQTELVDTETKIMISRNFYNVEVRYYNTSLRLFPTNLIAGYLSFTPQDFFDVDDVANVSSPPKIKF